MTKTRLQIFAVLGLVGTVISVITFILLLRDASPNVDVEPLIAILKLYCAAIFPLSLLMLYVFKFKPKEKQENSEVLDDVRVVVPRKNILKTINPSFYLRAQAYNMVTLAVLFLFVMSFSWTSTTMIAILYVLFIIYGSYWFFGSVFFVLWLVTGEFI